MEDIFLITLEQIQAISSLEQSEKIDPNHLGDGHLTLLEANFGSFLIGPRQDLHCCNKDTKDNIVPFFVSRKIAIVDTTKDNIVDLDHLQCRLEHQDNAIFHEVTF